METVRAICSLAHAQRQKAQLKVRQPLALITIGLPTGKLDQDLIDVILEETNIKSAKVEKSADLTITIDTNLTPDLIEEGNYRDLVRSIQVLRKEKGLALRDRITIVAPTWPKSFESAILEKTLSDSITAGPELTITPVSVQN
jgi:isoleucyl-tRNA synthetase